MTISIWRYSHLLLAIVSSLFIIVASLTGIILAFEPIKDASQPYGTLNLKEVSLAETIDALKKNYTEVLELEIDANNFVIASVINTEGNSERIYINPVTSEKLGTPKEKLPLFQWATNLHRSLFLKRIGRVFVGLISFLLCFISSTGFILLIKRQGGFLKIFSKVQKEYIAQRFHVVLGRWFILPILVVAATGVYLSAEKFSLLPESNLQHHVADIVDDKIPDKRTEALAIFKELTLDKVRSVHYPFSEFPEDYFELALNDREIYVHQYTGEILSEVNYPFVTLASRFSMVAHTGKGSILWSLVLLITSASLLFFIYSGFVIALKRRKKIKAIGLNLNKDECEFILLVGSETGRTNDFATHFQNALTKAGKTVFKSELNNYSSYKKAKHIIVFTATYGDGDAPTNARKFKKLFKQLQVSQKITYSILGFGSKTYPEYCKFAVEVDNLFHENSNFTPYLELHKINNSSYNEFKDWVSKWSKVSDITLALEPGTKIKKELQKDTFKVISKTNLDSDATFLIRLRPKNKVTFQSGDLLSYQPTKNENARLYSVAKHNNDILLSIKKHKFGLCSSYFSQLSNHENVTAAIQTNEEFHFPKKAKEIICIANGTGIAPFLGIIDENQNRIPIHLFWGGRTKASFTTYKTIIDNLLQSKKLSKIDIAYSQEYEQKIYVQHLLEEVKKDIAKQLKSGAVFMICGSIAMQHEVLTTLENIALQELNTPLHIFEQNQQLKMDCY